MNDLANIVPIAASALGIASPTLVLAVGLLHLAAKAVSRLIPDTKTGVLGTIRKAAKVFGVEPTNRVFDDRSIVGIASAGAPAITDLIDLVGAKAATGTVAVLNAATIAPATSTADAIVADLATNAQAAASSISAAEKLKTLINLKSLLGKLKS